MLAEGSLEQWLKEHDEMFAQLDDGDYSALEGLFIEVPGYVIEWWVSVPEPLNGIRKDLMYIIYGYDTPQNVKAWINSQSSVLTALHYVKIAIKERKEREVLRKMFDWV